MTKNFHTYAIYVIISVALLVGTVIVAINPMQISAQPKLGQVCVKATPQPADPLNMNTVVLPNLEKTTETIHVEKEIFQCTTSSLSTSGGILRHVTMKDVYVITEILGDSLGHDYPSFEVISCTRSPDGGDVLCVPAPPPSYLLTTATGLNCTENSPSFPLEMNTINTPNAIKTVISEKHV